MGLTESLVGLVPVVPFAAFFAMRYRCWWLMAIAAAMVLPIALVSHAPYMVFWLCAFALLALAVALRWRVGIAGRIGFVLTAVAVWGVAITGFAFGPRELPYDWVLVIAPLVGLLALGWDRAPWRTQA